MYQDLLSYMGAMTITYSTPSTYIFTSVLSNSGNGGKAYRDSPVHGSGVPERDMGIAGRHKQVYLRPAPHLKQVPHHPLVQAPLHGIHHILEQVVGKNVVIPGR